MFNKRLVYILYINKVGWNDVNETIKYDLIEIKNIVRIDDVFYLHEAMKKERLNISNLQLQTIIYLSQLFPNVYKYIRFLY